MLAFQNLGAKNETLLKISLSFYTTVAVYNGLVLLLMQAVSELAFQ